MARSLTFICPSILCLLYSRFEVLPPFFIVTAVCFGVARRREGSFGLAAARGPRLGSSRRRRRKRGEARATFFVCVRPVREWRKKEKEDEKEKRLWVGARVAIKNASACARDRNYMYTPPKDTHVCVCVHALIIHASCSCCCCSYGALARTRPPRENESINIIEAAHHSLSLSRTHRG